MANASVSFHVDQTMKKLCFLLSSLVVLAILLVALDRSYVKQPPQSLDEKAQEVYRSLMCPLCPGQTIAQSQSELSAQMRGLVREKLEQGETKEEILRFFAERYGEAVLAAPVRSGFNLAAWVIPFAAIVVGGILMWRTIRKWVRQGRGMEFSSKGIGPPAETSADDEKYLERVERELREFREGGDK
ncbi:MAG: cycL [Dehalococcoidia bacterium]|nr:cycL [Dehalococcoidia bacterium]